MMKLYFAGAETSSHRVNLIKYKVDMLATFFALSSKIKKSGKVKQEWGIPNELIFFLDSGGFTAFTQGAKIDLDEYITFINKCDADYYAALDVIGNGPESLKNLKYMMEKLNLDKKSKLVPTFHYGDDWKYLDYYIENFEYVALGGMVGAHYKTLMKWLDAVFSKYPNHKYHGFGLTAYSLIFRYPFFSVDSTSWLQGQKFGCLIFPDGKNVYHVDVVNSTTIKNTAYRKQVLDAGYTMEEITNDYMKRTCFCIESYIKIRDSHNTTEFKIKQNQLNSYFKTEPNPISKETIIINYNEWVEENYGDVPEELAKKLIKHQFGVENVNI